MATVNPYIHGPRPITGLNECSRRIAEKAKRAEGPLILFATPRGIVLTPLIGEEYFHIGHKNISRSLMSPSALDVPEEQSNINFFGGQTLLIHPQIKGGILKKCLKSLINSGLKNSAAILVESRIKVQIGIPVKYELTEDSSVPAFRTIKDLTSNVYSSLRLRIAAIGGFAEDIQTSAENLNFLASALKAAAILGKDRGGLIDTLPSDMRNMASFVENLESVCAEIDTFMKKLQPATTGQIEAPSGQGQLTIDELKAFISQRFNKELFGTSAAIEEIKALVASVGKKLAILRLESRYGQDTYATLEELSALLIKLQMVVCPIQKTSLKCIETLHILASLPITATEKTLTVDMLEDIFKTQNNLPAIENGKKASLPQITMEMASHVRILVVDDDADITGFSKDALEKHGFKVITANSGEKGLLEFRKGSFDLVISDFVMLRGMDGVDFVRELLQSDPDLPVFIRSGTPLYSSAKLSGLIGEGKVGFIIKDPKDKGDILDPAIRVALKKAGIAVTAVETSAPTADKPKKTPEPLEVWRGRISHKLNNAITTLLGYSEMLLGAGTTPNERQLNSLCTASERCQSTIKELRRFAEGSGNRQIGDIELLPDELKNDEEVQKAVAQLSAFSEAEYDKLARVVAATVVMYEPILEIISKQIALYEQNHDGSVLRKIIILTNRLIDINNALYDRNLSESTKTAEQTIDYLVNNF